MTEQKANALVVLTAIIVVTTAIMAASALGIF